MSSMYPQYESDKNAKRILRGNHDFHSAMLAKMQQNNPAEIFSFSHDQLRKRLMEFATELLNTNENENKGNFWHFLTDEEDLKKAEELVNGMVNDIQFMNSDPVYNAYIDFIRANTQADQLTDDDYLKKPQAEPGTTSILPDLYIELLRPIYEVRHGGFEVHTSANLPILPANINSKFSPNTIKNLKKLKA